MSKVYTIEECVVHENQLSARLRIDRSHKIFAGHFPEKPILPGVVEIEIIRGVLSKYFGRKYRIQKIKSAKYVGMFLPDEGEIMMLVLDFKLLENTVKVKAVLKYEDQVFLKFSGEFIENE